MKTFTPYFLAFILSLTQFSILANRPTCYPGEPGDNNYVRYLSDGTFIIKRYIGSDTSITIPSHFNNIEVSAIDTEAFYGNTTLKEIHFPASIRKIGDKAFAHCDSLELIAFQSQHLTIGDAAFANCNNLKEVNLPEGIDSIGNYAFSYCRQLSKVTVFDKDVFYAKNTDSCNIFCKKKGFVDNVFMAYNGSTTEALAKQMNYSFSLITTNGTITNVKAVKDESLRIYPSIINKGDNKELIIETNNLDQEGELCVYRLSGEIILRQKIQQSKVNINLDNLAINKGMYLVILSSFKGKYTKKFIVR